MNVFGYNAFSGSTRCVYHNISINLRGYERCKPAGIVE